MTDHQLQSRTLGFGTAPLAFGDLSARDSAAIVRRAVDVGIGLIDTALAYTRPGAESWAEDVVRQALAGLPGPDRPLVATKGGHYRTDDGFPVDGRPDTLKRHAHASLQHLGVERIDLYQLHHVDPTIPVEESVGALHDLREAGDIRFVGVSNVSVAQIQIAESVTQIYSVQNRLSVLDQGDSATARYCHSRGIAYLAYMPFGGVHGTLSSHAGLRTIASKRGASVQQVALAWLRNLSPAIVPVFGSTRASSVEDNARASLLTLTRHDQKLLCHVPAGKMT